MKWCAFYQPLRSAFHLKPQKAWLLAFFAFFTAIGTLHGQSLKLSGETISVPELFKKIKQQTGIVTTFDLADVKGLPALKLPPGTYPVPAVLDKALKPYGFTYSIMSKTIFVAKVSPKAPVSNKNGHNDTSTVSTMQGIVTDTLGKPMEGVSVRLKGSSQGISTDKDGRYMLQNTSTQNPVLIFSFVGHRTEEVTGIAGMVPDVIMHIQEMQIKEQEIVVSTGYQKLPKERATGSFVQVNNTLINRRVSTDIISRLENIVPGLLFNHNTYKSSTGSDLNIRGHSTLFANDQPLIILDNFPYNGDLSSINPNDVENITILKDAAASSIWGAKSGNGVIVITTKKGIKNSKPAVELNSNITIGSKPDVFYDKNFLNSNDFINVETELFKRGFYNNDLTSLSMPVVSPVVNILDKEKHGSISNAEAETQINALRNVDVRNEIEKYFYQQSVNQQYALNVKGGGNAIDYFLSLGLDKNKANLTGNNTTRNTINSKINIDLTPKLRASVGFLWVQTDTKQNNTLSASQPNTKNLYPYAQFSSPNGNHLSIVKEFNTAYTDTVGNGKLLDWNYRPLDELNYAYNRQSSTDNLLNLGLQYTPSKDLSLEMKYQYGKSISVQNDYSSEQTYAVRTLINKFTQISATGDVNYPVPKGGILYLTNNQLVSQNARAQVNYHKFWGEHELTAIAGAELNQSITQSNANTTYGYDIGTGAFTSVNFVDYFSINPNSGARIPNYQNFNKLTDRFISYFSNAAYTFKNRYTFSASGRIDKSNLFGVNTNNKSVPLYSVGGSWNISNEAFYNINWLPFAKLRMTYGYNGNVDKSVTAVTTIRQTNGSYISGMPYAVIANPGNPDLRWEKIRTINWGADFSTSNNRFSGSIEYYRKNGIDLFGNMPLPGYSGWPTFKGNYATTKGSGWDVVLGAQNIQKNSFSWHTQLIFSKAQDIVTRYDVKGDVGNYLLFSNGNNGLIYPLAGKPLFAIYAYKSAGLTHDTGDPQGYLNGKLSTDYSAILNATTIDSMVYMGPSRPTIFGSLRNTFSFKQFSVSFNIAYKLNYYFRRNSIFYSQLFTSWNGHEDFTKRWQKPGDEAFTGVPSLQYPPANSARETFYLNSQALVNKGDHVRLQDITLSYDIDKSSWKASPFNHLQLYCYVNNIGILWRANNHGLDPDLNGSGLPLPRSFAAGLRINF
ncbi:TonB-linked outer membrane protein, SusC/RagA family [Chryseobacterium populi]|uniref:TonB-linked outer membrane protein, SusC/RagA family n=2 Tax=Chryseobacterium populi TaxID=1144316 RepID=J2KMR4_9FLAO|nr:TonB-linked outer membrane protein, SusC/RagA family [Chryseobacterium populi]